jgi:hypothetical protein
MRTHLKLSTVPLRENRLYKAECGMLIKHAHLEFQTERGKHEIKGLNTIRFCSHCITAALRSTKGRRYVYGLSEATEVKTKKRTEEFVS